jgi:hypothetical protein
LRRKAKAAVTTGRGSKPEAVKEDRVDRNEQDWSDGPVYQAGEFVPPGRYRRIDRPGPTFEISEAGPLRPSFDGAIALYAPVVTVADWRPTRSRPLAPDRAEVPAARSESVAGVDARR